MSDLSSIGGVNGSVGSVTRVPSSAPVSATGRFDQLTDPAVQAASPAAEADRVELSDFARYLDQLRQLPDIRQSVIDRVRQAIDSGTYETDDKLNAAIDQWAREELP